MRVASYNVGRAAQARLPTMIRYMNLLKAWWASSTPRRGRTMEIWRVFGWCVT